MSSLRGLNWIRELRGRRCKLNFSALSKMMSCSLCIYIYFLSSRCLPFVRSSKHPQHPCIRVILKYMREDNNLEICIESRKIFLKGCLVFEPTNKVYVDDVYACAVTKYTFSQFILLKKHTSRIV